MALPPLRVSPVSDKTPSPSGNSEDDTKMAAPEQRPEGRVRRMGEGVEKPSCELIRPGSGPSRNRLVAIFR